MIAGRYALDREVGRGGMGSVWLGTDEVLGRKVALKRVGLVPGAADPDARRARREARLAARLQHPNVVAVLDFVDDADSGEQWLVMEYVDGASLAQLVRRDGAFSPNDAAAMLRQVSDALTAAHAAGIVHRDVKPSNILVDGAGTAKLSDFGVAHIPTDPSLTQTGLLIGSPAYLAPEVAGGGRGDEAADVWSLGATAYYLLSGRPPYESGDNVLSTLYRIVHEDAPRLPEAGWLAPLIAGTLTKDPSRRWTLQQVRDHLDGKPQEDATRPVVPLLDDGARPDRRAGARPSMALLLGALAFLVVLGGVLYAALSGGTHAKKTASAPPTHRAHTSASTTPAAHKRPKHHRRHKRQAAPAPPTVHGMESFIRRYVATVAVDPDAGWSMLTPHFQRESGGLAKYRRFWSPATNGRVLDITANPKTMVVSYQVHFDNFHNGPGPTILKLVHHHGHYLIDDEMTKGFHPAT